MARIQISNDPSGRMIVSFPYDPLIVEKVKSIDGRRWHPAEKQWMEHFFESAPWSFPNSEGTLEKILKVFGWANMVQKTEVKTLRAFFAPRTLTKVPLRSPASRYLLPLIAGRTTMRTKNSWLTLIQNVRYQGIFPVILSRDVLLLGL